HVALSSLCSSGSLTAIKRKIPCRNFPKSSPSLKKFPALFHEGNFFEGFGLPLSPMLVSIFENAYKLELKQEIGNNIFSPAQ
ncbi:MAG: hypothetical protein KJ559_02770, partial [Nanoarchaeota archaeon]|nr:hypothetical protein [Nanoarchaeota archaeon]